LRFLYQQWYATDAVAFLRIADFILELL